MLKLASVMMEVAIFAMMTAVFWWAIVTTWALVADTFRVYRGGRSKYWPAPRRESFAATAVQRGDERHQAGTSVDCPEEE